ncbi:hypothetical protein WA158_004346 [Blastocystis sp. Blastoise]
MSSNKNNKETKEQQESILTPISFAVSEQGDYLDKSDNPLTSINEYIILGGICIFSFLIRLFAIVRFESVIHEYDPWFNYRASKYFSWAGPYDFLNWFDDRSWYPLGRIVGGTVYPGMMVTSAIIHYVLNLLSFTIQVRNVCVFLAPIFACATCIATFLLTRETSRRTSTALLAAAFVGLVPSYISRSVGGSYDYEAVAIFAMLFTFYLWVKSVNTGSLLVSACCALSYFYMVSSWGGYVFIINIIPIYVALMVLIRRYSQRLYIAYTTFYILGSILAMQVPFVGFNVVKQAECILSHGVFIGLQFYAILTFAYDRLPLKYYKRLLIIIFSILVFLIISLVLIQIFGITRWTGRSLTLLDPTYATKYIPIIASVSEHQPTTWTSFFFDLQVLVPLAPVGLFLLFKDLSDGRIFIIIYGTFSWYFAGVMVRLMLPLAPVVCILAAEGFSALLRRYIAVLKHSGKKVNENDNNNETVPTYSASLPIGVIALCFGLLVFFLFHSVFAASEAYSSPSIVIASRRRDGSRAIMDDYREAYSWMRMNTPEHSKFLSWWDYGYQMAGMGNRTVIVDNNTWNNTHIATVGRALASDEDRAYPILQSLDVDYVLVVFGGYIGYSGDDINKFLWMVRIAAGVYPDEIQESNYYAGGAYRIDSEGAPTLLNSVMYKLSYYRFGEVHIDPSKPAGYDVLREQVAGYQNYKLKHFEEAFTSEHWIIRIFKVKKDNAIDPSPERARAIELEQRKIESGVSSLPEYKYIGCTASENVFSSDKVYEGGTTGSSYNLAINHAAKNKKKYVAIARYGQDGHVFAFNTLQAILEKDVDKEGCERVCLDERDKKCGCSDSACTGSRVKGEKNVRRWAVYERVKKSSSKRSSRTQRKH